MAKSYNYNKGSYGVFAENIGSIDAYREIHEVEPIESYEPTIDAENVSKDDAIAAITEQPKNTQTSQVALQSTPSANSGARNSAPAATPTTTPSTPENGTEGEEKKWYEKLFENKVRLFIVAACAVVAGWLIFSKD